MNIVFLDIDGVVCTLRSHFAYENNEVLQAWDPTCCALVVNLCKQHFGKIVISSTWRFAPEVNKYLDEHKLTKYLHEDWKTKKIKDSIRGQEINEWLERHDQISNYVILDDDSDMLPCQFPHFIKTDTDEGFGSREFMHCKEILKRRTIQ